MILEAGELDNRVAVERRVGKKDAYGERAETWQELGVFGGRVALLNNRNIDLAKGFAATVNFDCKLRYHPEINNDCRCKIAGKHYEINGVIHDPQRAWSQLFLTQVTS